MVMNKEIEILTRWIEIAKEKKMFNQGKQFWLLRDYLEGDVWTEDFYDLHKKDVVKILDNLDQNKAEVKIIIDAFIKKGLYQIDLFCQIDLF